MIVDDDEQDAPHLPENWAQQLLDFWFAESTAGQWFQGGLEFDQTVAARFSGWRDVLRERMAESFLADARSALAAVILFDQVPRNAFRGHAEAFATDHLALAISRLMVERGKDRDLSKDERLFLYLPFEHSENVEDQRQSVHLISTLNDPELLRFARAHQAMIEQFGRFPGRNKALGREDRQGESEALADAGPW